MLIAPILTSGGTLQSFLSVTVCKNRTSSRTSTMVITGAVVGVISMMQTVDGPDVNVICICNDLRTLSCS